MLADGEMKAFGTFDEVKDLPCYRDLIIEEEAALKKKQPRSGSPTFNLAAHEGVTVNEPSMINSDDCGQELLGHQRR